MIKVLIIEDEPLVAKDLEKQLKNNIQDLEVLAVTNTVSKSISWLQSNTPDLIFADIQLADGSSFEIFEKVQITCPIIFTTAYDEYAVKAFHLNSIDYLLKPIDRSELKRAIDKYRNLHIGSGNVFFREQLELLMQELKTGKETKFRKRFTGHIGKSIVAVNSEDVSFFQKDVLIFLTTTDNRKIVTDFHSLEELEDVTDPTHFFRANRQFIVSVNGIQGFQSHYTGKLILELKAPVQAEITVSREKAAEFKRWFEQ